MEYERIVSGRFVRRYNRFVAAVELEGREVLVHVKNTGRCGELFLPGARVFLEDHRHRMGQRKLAFSLVAVEKDAAGGRLLVNTDSQAPNKVTGEALDSGHLILPGLADPVRWVPEQRFGDSRLDFFLEDSLGRRGFLEVKGVTLEERRQAAFPDAPTLRGRKHAQELIRAAEAGYQGFILFVLQMEGMEAFRPNDAMDPAFGEALRAAARAGIGVLAYDCRVGPSTLVLNRPVPVIL